MGMVALFALVAGCSNPPIAATAVDDAPIAFGPGPTIQSRVPGGYQLLNRDLRVIVSDQTGDVICFGPADGKSNLIAIRAAVDNLPEGKPVGSIEARDEQTWQFFGDDPNGLRWRKIYCLEGDHLYASFIVENTTRTTRVGRIALTGDMPAGVIRHDFEHCDVNTLAGIVSLRGWNLEHDSTVVPAPIWIASDPMSWQPDQRLGYTTDWQLQPAGGS